MSYAIKHGYTSTPQMALDLGKVLVAAGYTVVGVDGAAASSLPANVTDGAPLTLVLDSSAAVDPCFAQGQTFRVKITGGVAAPEAPKEGVASYKEGLDIYVATPLQIGVDGTVVTFPYNVGVGGQQGTYASPMGRISRSLNSGDPNSSFFYSDYATGTAQNQTTLAAVPQSMMITVAKHGFAVMVWSEGYDDTGAAFSWMAVQRGVNASGAAHVTKKAPLWCVFSVGGRDVNQFVVRESDVNAPTRAVTASEDGTDCNRLFNIGEQVSITEDEKFNLAIPRDITTQRYFYPLELDLIGYTSADVISQYAEAPVRMYGEAADRVYKAMNANGSKNTNMRILFLAKQDEKLIDVSGVLASA